MTQAANLGALGTNVNSSGIAQAAGGGTAGTAGVTGFKNRIINGDMTISQRNGTSSVTIGAATVTYTVDRWAAFGSQASKFSVQQNAGSVTPPAGFTNYLGCTSLSSYTVGSSEGFWVRQPIEGFNIADLGWGTANAKTVTLSFWVRSSLTGTFGGTLIDNYTPYAYPFSYTISSANTWEQKSVTIVGPTSGTFPTNNTVGTYVQFSIGTGSSFSGTGGSWQSANLQSVTGATSVVGTNGATWYITGVQLEVGTAATNFDVRSYGTELGLCQRYYQFYGGVSYSGIAAGMINNTNTKANIAMSFCTVMRASPALSFSNLIVTDRTAYDTAVSSVAFAIMSPNGFFSQFNLASTAGGSGTGTLLCVTNGTTGTLVFNAEL